MSNQRGQYGRPQIGAEWTAPTSATPWLLGLGVALVGLTAVLGARATKPALRSAPLSTHDKEVRAWERQFPGLPWYADQVKASQVDAWERARDQWERTH